MQAALKRTPLKRTRFTWKPRSRKTKTRTILYGKEYADLRRERAMLAEEICECGCGKSAPYVRGIDQPLWAGQLAHLERGAKRSSTLEEVRWFRRECHDLFDNRNQKVIAKREA